MDLTLTMIHRGEVVERVVRKSGIKMGELAKRLKISRSTLYHRFQEIQLDLDFINRLGKILNYDFSEHFQEVPKKQYLENFIERDPPVVPDCYTPGNMDECLYELVKMQKKYITLLERHNRFVEDYILDKSNERS